MEDRLSQIQLEYINKLFNEAKAQNKFIFLKGGWNIDLQYGSQTRKHDDIDFIFNIEDKEFWLDWNKKQGLTAEIVDEYYSIYKSMLGLVVDFEGATINGAGIIWKHGGVSPMEQVVKTVQYDKFPYLGMKLNVEKYLKEKGQKEGKEIRTKDTQDIEILDKMLATQ